MASPSSHITFPRCLKTKKLYKGAFSNFFFSSPHHSFTSWPSATHGELFSLVPPMHNWSWLGKWEVAPAPLRGGVPPLGSERRAWSRSSQCGGRSEVEVQAAGMSALGVCNWGEGISWAVPGSWWLPQSHLTFVVLQTQPSSPVAFGCATLRVSNSRSLLLFLFCPR